MVMVKIVCQGFSWHVLKLCRRFKERLMSLVRIVWGSRANRRSTRFGQFSREAGVPAHMQEAARSILPLLHSWISSSLFTQNSVQYAREFAISKHHIYGNSEAGVLCFRRIRTNKIRMSMPFLPYNKNIKIIIMFVIEFRELILN